MLLWAVWPSKRQSVFPSSLDLPEDEGGPASGVANIFWWKGICRQVPWLMSDTDYEERGGRWDGNKGELQLAGQEAMRPRGCLYVTTSVTMGRWGGGTLGTGEEPLGPCGPCLLAAARPCRRCRRARPVEIEGDLPHPCFPERLKQPLVKDAAKPQGF